MRLASLTRPSLIFCGVPGTDGPTVLRALADRVFAKGLVPSAEELYRKLWEREELGSTGIGNGVAIPHCKLKGIDEVLLVVGIANTRIEFGAMDSKPVGLFFLLLSPDGAPAEHLRALASVSRWLKASGSPERLLRLGTPEEIYQLLEEQEEV